MNYPSADVEQTSGENVGEKVAGRKFPAFPAHAQPAILRIW